MIFHNVEGTGHDTEVVRLKAVGNPRVPRCLGSPVYSWHVDIDRFMADNRASWDRLEELTQRAKELSGTRSAN